jgi:hypothetical protein
MRRSTVLSLPLQLVFPAITFSPVRYSAPCSHIFLVGSKTVGSKNINCSSRELQLDKVYCTGTRGLYYKALLIHNLQIN